MVGVNSSGCVSVKRVAASSATNNYVVGKLNGTAVAGCFVGSKMPPGGGLSTAQIATVSAWINAGALNNWGLRTRGNMGIPETLLFLLRHRVLRPLRYPRKCQNQAARQRRMQTIPVALLLLPVLHKERMGLLVVRRAIEPQLGKLALVGGFVEEYETWQQGAAREAKEEAGVTVDPNTCPLLFQHRTASQSGAAVRARSADKLCFAALVCAES